jgi:predicted Zn-dependent peptidase
MRNSTNYNPHPPFIFTLKNGIRIIHKECYGDVSCCGLAVNAGTRFENEDEKGLAHFTEHMLFKGTENRNSRNILNRMERVGGDLDAYTTKEETVVYSTFLREDYDRAIELVSDLIFHSVFPDDEIDKERDVILDEINSYEDSPSELIFDDFDQLIFPGHPIGRKILGDPDCLNTFRSDAFHKFHSRNYTTDRIVFFSQSAIPAVKVVKLAEKYLGDIPVSNRQPESNIVRPVAMTGLIKEVGKDTHQAHVIYGNKSYSLFEDDRVGMYLLNNILGGPGMNSRLNLALREKTGLVYSVESSATSFTDTGLFTIYFGTDPSQADRCLSIVKKELRKLCEKPLTSLQLMAARKQLYGQVLISAENKESQTLSMGKSLMYYGKYDSMEELIRKIESITPQRLMEIAREVFNPDTMSLLIYR